MTEPVLDGGAAAAGPATPVTAGGLLRAARERQGLHIAALAAAIKVSPKKLEALEADRWSELPDATFTRALAQTVCRTLKIDAKMVLDKLPAVEGVNLALTLPTETDTGGAPARPGAVAAPRARAGAPGLVWGAVLLLVGAGVLGFLPAGWSIRPASPTPPPVVASAPAAVASVAAPMPASAADPGLAAAAAASASVPPQPPVPDATASAVITAPAPAVPATAPAVGAAGAAFELVATQDSWIEVRDANGTVLASRLVSAGERLGLDGVPPLRATIGNVAGTELRWRGQRIDLAARHQGNVARIELP